MMKLKYFATFVFGVQLFTCALIPLSTGSAAAAGGVEYSYHGQLGHGTGTGMLEKWCALPNFSFEKQGGVDGWTSKPCNDCHIGAAWNPEKPTVDCTICHTSAFPGQGDATPNPAKCLTCHYKDTAKRGDMFTAEEDVHAALGMYCQDCHVREKDGVSNHQFRKGSIIDTTEETMKGELSCIGCHGAKPHRVKGKQGEELNRHAEKVACETCHTGLRPAAALASRQWNVFNEDGTPLTRKRAAGWLPEHKWYDNTGPGQAGNYLLPILGYTERRDAEGAKIYPFNTVTVDWFVITSESGLDEVVPVPEVKAADTNFDRVTTIEEVQVLYPDAALVTADMNFSVSHSVVPLKIAFDCKDCHGRNGWVLDWKQLGYTDDPKKGGKGGSKKVK